MRVKGDVPAARVVDAFTRIAFLEFGQIETCAEVIAFAVDDGGTGFSGQVLEHIAQRFDQAIVQCVAFGRTAQTHHGDSAVHFKCHAVGGSAFEDRIAGLCH